MVQCTSKLIHCISLSLYSHHIMDGHHSDVHDHTDADDLIGKIFTVLVQALEHVYW